MRAHTDKVVEKVRILAKARASLPTELCDQWPQIPSLPPSNDKNKLRKYWRGRCKTQASYAGHCDNDKHISTGTNPQLQIENRISPRRAPIHFPNLSGQSNDGDVLLKSHLIVAEPVVPILQSVKCRYIGPRTTKPIDGEAAQYATKA